MSGRVDSTPCSGQKRSRRDSGVYVDLPHVDLPPTKILRAGWKLDAKDDSDDSDSSDDSDDSDRSDSGSEEYSDEDELDSDEESSSSSSSSEDQLDSDTDASDADIDYNEPLADGEAKRVDLILAKSRYTREPDTGGPAEHHYLVRWKGMRPEGDSWEPESTLLINASASMQAYGRKAVPFTIVDMDTSDAEVPAYLVEFGHVPEVPSPAYEPMWAVEDELRMEFGSVKATQAILRFRRDYSRRKEQEERDAEKKENITVVEQRRVGTNVRRLLLRVRWTQNGEVQEQWVEQSEFSRTFPGATNAKDAYLSAPKNRRTSYKSADANVPDVSVAEPINVTHLHRLSARQLRIVSEVFRDLTESPALAVAHGIPYSLETRTVESPIAGNTSTTEDTAAEAAPAPEPSPQASRDSPASPILPGMTLSWATPPATPSATPSASRSAEPPAAPSIEATPSSPSQPLTSSPTFLSPLSAIIAALDTPGLLLPLMTDRGWMRDPAPPPVEEPKAPEKVRKKKKGRRAREEREPRVKKVKEPKPPKVKKVKVPKPPKEKRPRTKKAKTGAGEDPSTAAPEAEVPMSSEDTMGPEFAMPDPGVAMPTTYESVSPEGEVYMASEEVSLAPELDTPASQSETPARPPMATLLSADVSPLSTTSRELEVEVDMEGAELPAVESGPPVSEDEEPVETEPEDLDLAESDEADESEESDIPSDADSELDEEAEEYERQRLANIEANMSLLRDLELNWTGVTGLSKPTPPPPGQRAAPKALAPGEKRGRGRPPGPSRKRVTKKNWSRKKKPY